LLGISQLIIQILQLIFIITLHIVELIF